MHRLGFFSLTKRKGDDKENVIIISFHKKKQREIKSVQILISVFNYIIIMFVLFWQSLHTFGQAVQVSSYPGYDKRCLAAHDFMTYIRDFVTKCGTLYVWLTICQRQPDIAMCTTVTFHFIVSEFPKDAVSERLGLS